MIRIVQRLVSIFGFVPLFAFLVRATSRGILNEEYEIACCCG